MLLMLIGWGLVVLFVLMAIWGTRKGEDGLTIPGYICSIILGLAMAITSIAIPISNQSKLQEMEAFYQANEQNYAITTSKATTILSEQEFVVQAIIPIEGSIEKIEVGSKVIERLTEWRNEVVKYNNILQKFKYFDTHLWIGYYYPSPEGLKLLIIK